MVSIKLALFFIIFLFSIFNYFINKNFWSLTYIKTFLIFYFLFIFIFLLSSILKYLKRERIAGLFNLSIFFFSSFIFLSLSYYNKIELSIGEGEGSYNLEKNEGGFLSKGKNYDLNLKEINEKSIKIFFEKKEFNLKEKEGIYFKDKYIKLKGIFKSIEINVFQEGGYSEGVFFKLKDEENSYFPLSTLPYRIYIKNIKDFYKIKIYRNKTQVLEKEIKLGEIFPFDFLNLKLNEGPLWALLEVKNYFSFFYFLIPLIFFILSFYDKLKK